MYSVPDLPYSFSALEPHIDTKTMEIHHDKHHASYVKKLNDAVEGTKYAELEIDELLLKIDELDSSIKTAVRNNGGGHYNHSLFWGSLTSDSTEPSSELQHAITEEFGSLDAFKEQFADAAASRFGSGWAWLVVNNGKLSVCSTANQDCPLMGEAIAGCKGTPILGLDVWEHAYYLNYQNRRPDYIDAFWNVVNWTMVSNRYATTISNN